MNRFIKKSIKWGSGLLLLVLINILIITSLKVNIDNSIEFEYTISANNVDVYQVFYSNNNEEWNEKKAYNFEYNEPNKEVTFKCRIPGDTQKIRLDFGSQLGEINLKNIKYKYLWKCIDVSDEILSKTIENVDIARIENMDNGVKVVANGKDPYSVMNFNDEAFLQTEKNVDIMIKVLACLFLNVMALVLVKCRRNVVGLFKELYKNKRLIWNLSKNDFKTKYAGSYLGITWAFVQPIVTILVYWFVFEFGLRIGSPMENVPYVLWFMAGLVPWFFFQEALLNATNCMLEYSYLVKKVVFKISILPIVKIISSLFVHLVFVGFLLIVGGIYGFYPIKFIVQLMYYSFCIFALVLALSYATCAIVIFFKDFVQIISIFLQVGMWMSPIMWSYTMIPQNYRWIMELNPMFYIVEGYRDSFITKVWFFEKYFQTAYFWIVVVCLFAFGTMIFKRLKPHFADVL